MENHKLPKDNDWIIHITKSLEEELEDNVEGVPVSIFNVPKTLVSLKSEAYTPQLVALGPYHHKRVELFEMERYKLISARRIQNKLDDIKFHDLVQHFAESNSSIRACYHRFLEFDRETLAWMLAIDCSFLLEFLQTYTVPKKEGNSLTCVSSSVMTHLVDYTRRKSSHHAILRDIVMLENQIPLFLLRDVHFFFKLENHEQEFAEMLIGFCRHLSPLKIRDGRQNFTQQCFRSSHLLELLYVLVTPNIGQLEKNEDQCEKVMEEYQNPNVSFFIKSLNSILSFIWYVNSAIYRFLGRICKSSLLVLLLKIIKCIGLLKTAVAVEKLISSTGKITEQVESISHDIKNETPLIEEITIPNVTELCNIGVKFYPSKYGLNKVKFDKSSAKFHLPVVDLDDNSEVVLRNLVAYEASIAPEAMTFTRYTELMNGLIDTKEDVQNLRKAGIILNRLKSDEEVANLWNGMTRTVKTTRVPVLDKAIEGVNEYYSGLWRVKMKMAMKKYVFSSWPLLTFLAANLLIILSALQTFCSLNTCSKFLSYL